MSTSTSTPTPTPNPRKGGNGGSSSLGPIIGGVVGGVLVAIAVVVVILVVIIYLKRSSVHVHRFDETKDQMMSEPVYTELHKPSPPPLPRRFYPGAYAQIDAPTGDGQIELVDINHNRVSVCSAPTFENPTLSKLRHPPDFLQGTWASNPKYMSAEGLDIADGGPNRHRMRFGSVPALDMPDSPNQSLLNIYAQPSRVAPPLPQRMSTPPASVGATACPLYSEATLTPTLFRQQHRSRQSETSPDVEIHPYASSYADPRPLRRSEGPLEVTHENVTEIRTLGVGQFGQVVLAKTVGVSLKDLKLSESNNDRSIGILVAMKKLKPRAEPLIKEAFEKEIKFMSRLRNDNVVSLLAICSSVSPFILMEYMENGDLNQYLRKHEIALSSELPLGENQIAVSPLHGYADCQWHEVPGIPQVHPQRPGNQKLSRR